MLVALIYLYLQSALRVVGVPGHALTLNEQILIFLAFLAAFAVKVPMWPVHTWLPDAHVEAPTGARWCSRPSCSRWGATLLRFSCDRARCEPPSRLVVIALSLIAVVYIGFVALAQTDMKKLIAYSSIAHMGFVTLGSFIGIRSSPSPAARRASRWVSTERSFRCWSMAWCPARCSCASGSCYDRVHSRDNRGLRRVVNTMPAFAAFMVLFSMANAGLRERPGCGRVPVILASFKANVWYAFLAARRCAGRGLYAVAGEARDLRRRGERQGGGVKDLDGREYSCSPPRSRVLLVGLWPRRCSRSCARPRSI